MNQKTALQLTVAIIMSANTILDIYAALMVNHIWWVNAIAGTTCAILWWILFIRNYRRGSNNNDA